MPAPVPPTPPSFPVPVLQVRPWADPVIDELGFELRSAYVERFWLATLGPSTTFLLRRLADRFDIDPDGFDLDLADTASRLGLAARGGRHSPFNRALERTTKFGLARRHGTTLEVRRRVPPLTLAQLGRLPRALQDEHAAWQAASLSTPERDQQRRARRIALGLLGAGDTVDLVERQLHQLHVHPAVAHDAVRWARRQLAADQATAEQATAAPDPQPTHRPAA